MEQQVIGRVVHYFSHLGVAGIELSESLDVGDVVYFRGATTDFCQLATSVEIDHRQVAHCPAGALVGLQALQRVRRGDRLYKIVGPDRLKALEDLDVKEAEREI